MFFHFNDSIRRHPRPRFGERPRVFLLDFRLDFLDGVARSAFALAATSPTRPACVSEGAES